MKTCTKCDDLKSLKDFFVRDKKTGRLHAQCKACYKVHRKTYHKYHYAKYRQGYLKRASKRNTIVRAQAHDQLIQYLRDKCCSVCGFSDIRALEFDHIDPKSKLFGIARGISNGTNWDKILIEIKKCRIVCANCHKMRTAEQFNWYRMARWPRS